MNLEYGTDPGGSYTSPLYPPPADSAGSSAPLDPAPSAPEDEWVDPYGNYTTTEYDWNSDPDGDENEG
jgi:hypothetical protein